MDSKSQPVRLDPQITAFAKAVADRMSRSLAEQLSHWARIGREIELSPDVSVPELRRVLSGQVEYDALPARGQAFVRAAWTKRMDELRNALRLDQEFKASGYRYAELDEHGEVVVRPKSARGRKTLGKPA
jgi:hypothetical protein